MTEIDGDEVGWQKQSLISPCADDVISSSGNRVRGDPDHQRNISGCGTNFPNTRLETPGPITKSISHLFVIGCFRQRVSSGDPFDPNLFHLTIRPHTSNLSLTRTPHQRRARHLCEGVNDRPNHNSILVHHEVQITHINNHIYRDCPLRSFGTKYVHS